MPAVWLLHHVFTGLFANESNVLSLFLIKVHQETLNSVVTVYVTGMSEREEKKKVPGLFSNLFIFLLVPLWLF